MDTLSNGLKIPAIGLGTDEIKDDKEGIREAVKIAIDAGYRLFDTAPIYKTETLVGEAIREKIAEGVVKREDLYIVSKLWNTKHRQMDVVPACKKSIEKMGLDYVDLYLINWPLDYRDESDLALDEFDKPPRLLGETDYTETWRGMEDCVKLGLTRSIGVSNFNVEQISRIIEGATIKPVVCQDEVHVMLSQKRLLAYCHTQEIVVMAYSPLGNPSYVDPLLHNHLKRVLDNAIVAKLATKYNKTRAQVALRFLVDNYIIPIPKATSARHIYENIDIADFELTDEENDSLHDFDCEFRIRSHYAYRRHPRYPFDGGYWS